MVVVSTVPNLIVRILPCKKVRSKTFIILKRHIRHKNKKLNSGMLIQKKGMFVA